MGTRVCEDKAVEEEVVAQGNKLMAEALGAILAGQEAVYKKLPVVGTRGAGGQRKHLSSLVYVKLAQEMRMAVRLARLIREGTRMNWLVTSRSPGWQRSRDWAYTCLTWMMEERDWGGRVGRSMLQCWISVQRS